MFKLLSIYVSLIQHLHSMPYTSKMNPVKHRPSLEDLIELFWVKNEEKEKRELDGCEWI